MSAPIRGKVARILNSREIVINIGSKDQVTVGMRFEVMDTKGHEVKDPDTGELLGSIERPKVSVKITKVQDRLSLASTYKTFKVNTGGRGFAGIASLSESLMPPKWETKYETFKSDDQTWEDLDEDSSYVKIGDPVVQVIECIENSEDSDSEITE